MTRLREFSRSLPMALLRAREAVMGGFRPLLRRHGVTEQQWRVLRALSATEDTSASALAAMTCIGLPSLSRILRSLSERDLIVRRVKATDLRTTLVSLSPAGARFLRRAGAESEARYDALAAGIGRANLRRLYALLDRVTAVRIEFPDDDRRRAPAKARGRGVTRSRRRAADHPSRRHDASAR